MLDLTDLSKYQPLRGFATLLAFSQLNTLRISLPDAKDSDVPFIYPRLHQLTELKIVGQIDGSPLSPLHFVVCLFRLKSLCFDVSLMSIASHDMMAVFAYMPQLTSLALKGIDVLGTSLHCLTALVSLTVDCRCMLSPCLADAISFMQHLTCIRLLDRDGKFKLPSAALKPLKKLKALTLRDVETEPDFVEALAMLPSMTELQFVGPNHSVHPSQFYPQLGLLTNLVVLRIPCDWTTIEICIRSLAGRLPKLRKLQFCIWARSTAFHSLAVRQELMKPVTKSALFNAFPNLRRVSIIHLPNSVVWSDADTRRRVSIIHLPNFVVRSAADMRKICYWDLFI